MQKHLVKMRRRLAAILAIVFACLTFSPLANADSRKFRAAAAAVDITPRKFPVSMTGSFWDRKATYARDPLHARCLVLDDGKSKAVIVVCDSCLISREIFDEAKRRAENATGIPTHRMLMSATHTHSAPTAVPLAQCKPDSEYVKFLIRQIARSVQEANARLAPAEIGWAIVKEPSEVFNRRWKMKPGNIAANPFGEKTDRVRMNPPRGSSALVEPAGPTDPDVAVLSVRSLDGEPIALLANYSLHYVGGIPSGAVSADYFGEFARQIGRRLKVDPSKRSFVGMMSNGTSGDINNLNFRKPRPRAEPFVRVREVAAKIADAASAAYGEIKHRPWALLAMSEREIALGVRRPNDMEVERAKQILAKVKEGARRSLLEIYAQETLVLSKYPAKVKLKLQALRIGQLGITALPCEAFAAIGLEIKKRSPLKFTFTIGLANGYNGYLPTPEHHTLGGYETWRSRWSYLEADASRKIVTNLIEMLKETSR